MSVREYIGARYVPLFADPIQWDPTLVYEPLTVVTNLGASYVSRRMVPEGIQLDNTDYWVLWADYNAQLQHYIDEVNAFDGRIDALEDALPIADFSSVNTIDARFDAIEADDWVTTTRINDGAVTSDKIADGAITMDKLASAIQRYFEYVVCPEDYGAKGDGATDDSAAFQDMFDDISDKTVILLKQDATYLIEEGLTLAKNEVSMIALAENEFCPQIKFNTSDACGLTVTGYSFYAKNIQFVGQSANDTIILVKLDRDSSSAAGNIDSYIENCAFGYSTKALEIAGRNVKILHNIFSQINGYGIVVSQLANTTNTDMRGIIVQGNRFHDVWHVVSLDVTAYANEGCSTLIQDNYMDGGRIFYAGATDNVVIDGNFISRIEQQATNIINLMRTVKTGTSCSVSNNFVNAQQSFSGQFPRTFLFVSQDASGFINVSNNVCVTASLQTGAIIWFQGTPKRVVSIVGNMMINTDHTANIEVNGANQYGIAANNTVNGSVLTAGTMTAANNVNVSAAI